MIYLTILNTIAIIYLILSTKSKYYLKFTKEKTIFNNTLLGYRLRLWCKHSDNSASSKHSIYFKIRNKTKTESIEEACRMIAKYSQQQQIRQSLTAKVSWLKTMEEVKEFQKYYSCVNEELVN